MTMKSIKAFARWLLARLYQVEVTGFENFHKAGERVLVVANHTSFLDAVLLWAFLPGELTFAINTHVAKRAWVRPFLRLAQVFPMDPTNPLSSKALVRYLEGDRKAVIFPEGRITVTGSLMKVYDGPGMVADKAKAMVLPVRIDGAQYTPFSRLRERVRLRWFPKIRMAILPPHDLSPAPEVQGRDRRKYAGRMLTDLMTEMIFATSQYRRTLFSALLDARRVHGGRHRVIEDNQRQPLTYNQVLARSLMLGESLAAITVSGEYVGVMLPSMTATVAALMGLVAFRRIPAMLNYTLGAHGLVIACETARIQRVLTSRRFIEVAKLQDAAAWLGERVELVYLEDLAANLTLGAKLKWTLLARVAGIWHQWQERTTNPDDPAIVLFTSGSEGTSKGVVLSHANLLANCAQLAARVDFSAQDIILNALPLFHSFGLTAGTLLPLFSGMRTFFYPSPLHYRIVPEVAYEINATILFGTNTFLAGYGRHAHPYDFYSVRYVFAGAEKLQEETRRLWARKFGLRVFEGYGATEASPGLATNTPMEHEEGTVGRFLPGIDYHLEPVPGVQNGGRLLVRGPNVMLGYLRHSRPGELVPVTSALGEGWYDTGDIVNVDAQGYVRIHGRVKRFAKIGGEMVSLTAVEEMAAACWPGALHAAVAVADPRKGEQVVLVSNHAGAERGVLATFAKRDGIGEISVPKTILARKTLPLLGTGKVDYNSLTALVREELGL
jgi:acyl-[acyl-carrier-protein]-phospholipid O-acyltransferase/long-chain-fatty-acid--[acyl-carrier-protein] ligase